jgi:segregation and condensation protein A
LNLLFNPSLIDKQDVWQIDVVKLLENLLKLLATTGNRDLRICGVAILTSALIHRLKVESIFRLDKIANQRNENNAEKEKKDEEKVPIPEISTLTLPFRKETSYPVSIDDLLLILDNLITELTNPSVRKKTIDLEPIVTIDFQDYLIKFEKVIEEYELKLFEKISVVKEMIFNDFVFDMNELDIARYFIAMLYLAMRNKIEISYVNIKDIDNKEFKDLMDFKMKNGNNKDEDIELIKITVANN